MVHLVYISHSEIEQLFAIASHPPLFTFTTTHTMAKDFRFVPGRKTCYENIILLDFHYT